MSLASRALGGEVGFLKTYLQGYWFKRLPGPRAVILATRASIGLADGFPRESQPTDDDGNPIEGDPIIIEDLPASERFFAGGDTTIRGFALDTVGTPKTISPSGFPRGGNGVLIMNVELRIPVLEGLRRGGVHRRRQRLRAGHRLRRHSSCAAASGSACATVRRSGQSASISASSWIAGIEESRHVLHFSIGQAF